MVTFAGREKSSSSSDDERDDNRRDNTRRDDDDDDKWVFCTQYGAKLLPKLMSVSSLCLCSL